MAKKGEKESFVRRKRKGDEHMKDSWRQTPEMEKGLLVRKKRVVTALELAFNGR